jgi:hypothetical protein
MGLDGEKERWVCMGLDGEKGCKKRNAAKSCKKRNVPKKGTKPLIGQIK